jgi:hypothetical protein
MQNLLVVVTATFFVLLAVDQWEESGNGPGLLLTTAQADLSGWRQREAEAAIEWEWIRDAVTLETIANQGAEYRNAYREAIAEHQRLQLERAMQYAQWEVDVAYAAAEEAARAARPLRGGGGGDGSGGWCAESVLQPYFGANTWKAVKVCNCESGGRNVKNPNSTAHGPFQILGSVHGYYWDPPANIRYAVQLSRNGTDWSAWAASGDCHGLA